MNKPLIFFHIDKCGGTTVQAYLAKQFRQDEIKPVRYPNNSISAKATYPTISHFDMDLYEFNRKFVYDPCYRLIMGNYDTGILNKIPVPIVSLVVLRQPVERVVSLYQYVRREVGVFGQLAMDAETMGADKWIRQYVGLWENAMTLQLAGVRWSSEVYRQANEAIYQQAVRQLRAIHYIGIVPRLDELLMKLAEDMGWMPPEPKRLNVSVREVEVSAETRSFIETHCQYDIDLYQVAKEIAT